MSEQIIYATGGKEEMYTTLLPQIQLLLEGEDDLIACLANVTAVLNGAFHHLWTGFYLVKSEEELILGPFQGELACTRIRKGRGVCGTAWKEVQTQVVPDVHQFPGHIACDARSVSEIVVPLIRNREVWGVLDIDSDQYGTFDETDRKYLEKLCNEIISVKEYK